MSIRQKRNLSDRKKLNIAPEDMIQKLADMKPEDRPIPPAVRPLVTEIKHVETVRQAVSQLKKPEEVDDDEDFLDEPDEEEGFLDDADKEEMPDAKTDFLDEPDEEDFLDEPDDDEDFLDEPGDDEDFLDEPDDDEDFLDGSDDDEKYLDDPDEGSSPAETEPVVEKAADDSEDTGEEDFDDDEPDDDVLDEEDLAEIERIHKEKEARKALRAARKELRKKKHAEYKEKLKAFAKNPKESMQEWSRKSPNVKKTVSGWIHKLATIGVDSELDDENLDLEAKIRIRQNKNRIRIFAIGAAAVFLITGYGIYREVRVFHKFKLIDRQERQEDNATEYVTLKGLRLKCNPNGVTCVDRKNEIVWNTTFTMQTPIVDKCGDLVAVGSQRGNEIYIFDEDGLVSSFNVEHVLTKMKVTRAGDVAVILEDGQVTWINVYNKWGKLLVRDKTTMSESGYPIDMDISTNGYKMMVSFLGVNDDIESRVSFFNFSAVGQDNEGKLVNEERFRGNVIPEVKFMEGSYAIAFMDDGVTIFRGQQIPEECNRINVTGEIISEFSNEKYFGMVTESDEADSEHKFKMVIYRENGSRCGSVYFNYEYSNIIVNENQVILYNSNSMRIYSVTGKLQFSGEYNKPILKVIPTASSRKFDILTDDSLDTIKIK